MPIYEFHCEKCGTDSELLVSNSQWKGTKCPKCGSTRLEKKFSVFASSMSNNSGAPANCDGNPRSCCSCPHAHNH